MKYKIKSYETVEREIDVTFPYYFSENLSDEFSIIDIYGKKEEYKTTTIRISSSNGNSTMEVSTKTYSQITDTSYLNPIYESDEEEYNEAVKEVENYIKEQLKKININSISQ